MERDKILVKEMVKETAMERDNQLISHKIKIKEKERVKIKIREKLKDNLKIKAQEMAKVKAMGTEKIKRIQDKFRNQQI